MPQEQENKLSRKDYDLTYDREQTNDPVHLIAGRSWGNVGVLEIRGDGE